jgi:hypothetical protein
VAEDGEDFVATEPRARRQRATQVLSHRYRRLGSRTGHPNALA